MRGKRPIKSLHYTNMSEQNLTVGQRVTVLNNGNTYDTYHAWPHIEHVPLFEDEAMPSNGVSYTITYSAEHESGRILFVLDNRYIVGLDAFSPRGYDPFEYLEY